MTSSMRQICRGLYERLHQATALEPTENSTRVTNAQPQLLQALDAYR